MYNGKKAVTVFCGASDKLDKAYGDDAKALAKFLTSKDITLIYGAGSKGVMGKLGRSMLDFGGRVQAVITRYLIAYEKPFVDFDKLTIVENMSDRKHELIIHADAFIILAGGIGTLEEFFQILVAKQLNEHDKIIYILNTNNYWNKLIELTDHLNDVGSLTIDHYKLFEVCQDMDELKQKLSSNLHLKQT